MAKGSKNSALPVMLASILAKGQCRIHNIPRLRDIFTMLEVLARIGVSWQWDDQSSLVIDSSTLCNTMAPYELVSTMRASVLALGPLLARQGTATVSLPGGCAIGLRPIDIHLKGLHQLGAEITIEGGYIHASAKKLRGADLYLDFPSVGATENLLMAAVLAEGETVIGNAAREPEVVDLASFLSAMGAKISGAGTERIEVQGVRELAPTTYTIIADRIEAATFLLAGAITSGEVTVEGIIPQHLTSVLNKMKEAGIKVEEGSDRVAVTGVFPWQPIHIKTLPFPGFPTDMQSQFMALLSMAQGVSTITETVFENRFMQVAELRRMGADISIDGRTAVLRGVPFLSGAPVMASDLRASAALVLAGLVARGRTLLSRVYHIDRGYERIEERLSSLGASIQRIKNEAEEN